MHARWNNLNFTVLFLIDEILFLVVAIFVASYVHVMYEYFYYHMNIMLCLNVVDSLLVNLCITIHPFSYLRKIPSRMYHLNLKKLF